ncbi:MAG: hypothetical protein J6R08_06240 [Opitutales bacterium]|nr:hypothetical protein [Opitutales bacterium]
MDNFFFSDYSFGGSADFGENKWSERDWLAYVKRSQAEIQKISKLYFEHRRNMSFEDIMTIAGWNIATSEESDDSQNSEPMTLINHPVYIASRALIKCLKSAIEELVSSSKCEPMSVLHLSNTIHEASELICVAVNSTDLGEDLLARSYYKSALMALNSVLAKIGEFPEDSDKKEIANIIIFDLRQLCLNLSN